MVHDRAEAEAASARHFVLIEFDNCVEAASSPTDASNNLACRPEPMAGCREWIERTFG